MREEGSLERFDTSASSSTKMGREGATGFAAHFRFDTFLNILLVTMDLFNFFLISYVIARCSGLG